MSSKEGESFVFVGACIRELGTFKGGDTKVAKLRFFSNIDYVLKSPMSMVLCSGNVCR